MNVLARRDVQIAIFVVVGVIGLIWVLRPDPRSPEERIRAAIEAMVEGAENHDLDPFRDYLSEQLKDQSGLGKQDVLNRLRVLFLRHPSIHLQILSLEVSGSSNQVKNVFLELLMSSTSFPQDKGNYDIVFRLEDDTWRVFSLDWGSGYGQESLR